MDKFENFFTSKPKSTTFFGQSRAALKKIIFEQDEPHNLRCARQVMLEKRATLNAFRLSPERFDDRTYNYHNNRYKFHYDNYHFVKNTYYKMYNKYVHYIYSSSTMETLEARIYMDPLFDLDVDFRKRTIDAIRNFNYKMINKNLKYNNFFKINYNENIFNYLIADDFGEYDLPEQDYCDLAVSEEQKLKFTKNKFQKSKFSYVSSVKGCHYVVDNSFVRDEGLKKKLRQLIEIFEDMRAGIYNTLVRVYRSPFEIFRSKQVVEDAIEMEEFPEYQMDAQGVENVSQVKAGNVILTESRENSEDVAAVAPPNWLPYVSTDINSSYESMTDRWLKTAEIVWTKDHRRNQQLLELALPLDVIRNASYDVCDVPNTIPFKVHRYWSGDMEIKIQVNSNKFQIGQLQCAWWYQPNLDKNFGMRKNVWSGSQTTHCLISAGASNEATLRVPFKFHLPMLSNRPRTDRVDFLQEGRLLVFVLNPLSVSATGPTMCYGTVFVRFLNSKFTGQISGALVPRYTDIPVFQMNNIIQGALAGAVNSLIPNLDKPEDTTNSQYVVPIAAHSWAYGTDISEPLQSLRLSPKGRTQHPEVSSSETLIANIVQKYGLVNTITWSKNDTVGKNLFNCNAAPMLEQINYEKVSSSTSYTLDTYYLPPIAVVSSLFSFWRGSLKFRFDIIASMFHTGRLIVGYVPGAVASDRIELKHILAGPHMVFTLQESQQFCYEIPYIADRPFWSRQYQGNYVSDQVVAPSRLYMFVLNPLVPMESVTDKVYINVYMAASSDFELVIPVQPSLGCGWNSSVLYDKSELVLAKNFPYYPGVWHSFLDSKYLTFRYGTLSDQVVYWDPYWLKQSKLLQDRVISYVFTCTDVTVAGFYKNPQNIMSRAIYGFMVWVDPVKKTDALLVITADLVNAKFASSAYIKSKFDIKKTIQYLVATEDTTSNTYCIGNPYWVADEFIDPIRPTTVEEDGFDVVFQGERDTQDNVVTDNLLLSTGNGSMLYGEKFIDLKDVMRRYQAYWSFRIDTTKDVQMGQASIVLPLLPQGLDLMLGSREAIIEFSNRCREGHIPLILSGFRYYRGGMRIRIVCPTTRDLIAWVQHKPDRRVQVPLPVVCTRVTNGNCIANHTYGSFVQDCGVNSIIQLEIPFYKNNTYNLLQVPRMLATDESFYFSLGDLAIGFSYAKPDQKAVSTYDIIVYYSIADDFHCSTFQGFPPMVFLDDIKEQEVAAPQGMFDGLLSRVKNGVKDEVSATVKEQTDVIATTIESSLKDFKESILDTSFADIFSVSFVRVAISQAAHVIANYNYKSLAIALSSILVELGMATLNMTTYLIDQFIALFQYLKTKATTEGESGNQPNQPDVAEEAIPQSDMSLDEQASLGIITVIWTSICSLFSVVASPPKDIKSLTKTLVSDVPNCMRSGNVIFVFLRNILSVMEAMKCKLFGMISPSYKAILKLDESFAEIKSWSQEVIALDDPYRFEKEKFKQEYKSRVHVAFITGQLIYSEISKIDDQKIARLIVNLYKKIRDLREKMLEFGDDSFVRLEPFVIWHCGEAGIGKSSLTHDLAVEMLTSRNELCNVPPIYNHEISSDFWDSCVGNPVMVVDDIFNVEMGNILEKHLQTLFAVVSPVVLTPPKARLEDKGKPYNPKILILNSNKDFLNVNNITPDAVHRRRHVLTKVVKSSKKIVGCPHCDGKKIEEVPAMWLKDFHHIQFQIAENVTNAKDPKYGEPISYVEYKKFIVEKYKVIMTKNEEMFKEKSQQIIELMNYDPSLNPFEFSNIEKNKSKIVKEQDQVYKNMVKESILQSLKECFKTTTGKWRDMYTRMALRTCSMIPSSSDILDGDSAIIKDVKYIKSNGDEIMTCDFASTSGESQGDYSTFSDTYNHIVAEKMFNCKKEYDAPPPKENEPPDTTKVDLEKLAIASGEKFSTLFNYVYLNRQGETNIFCTVPFLQRVVVRLVKDRVAFRFRNLLKICNEAQPEFFHEIYNILNVDEMIYMENLDPCKHYRAKVEDVSYNKNKEELMYEGEIFGYECEYEVNGVRKCRKDCPWGSVAFKYLWFSEYILYNPNYLYFVELADKQTFLPKELRKQEIDLVIDTSKFKKLLKCAKDKVVEYLYSLSKLSMAVWKGVKGFLKILQQWLPVLIPILFVGAAMGGAVYLDAKDMERQINVNYKWVDFEGPQYNTLDKNVLLNAKVPVAKPQGEIPQFNVAMQRIKNNMFQITACFDDKIVKCCGVVLYDRQLLVLRHYLEELSVLPTTTRFYGKYHLRDNILDGSYGSMLDFWNLPMQYFNKRSMDGSYASNYCIITLPITTMQCKSLLGFIARVKDHEVCIGDGVMFENNGQIHQNLHIVSEKTRPMIIAQQDNSSRIILQELYSYKMQGKGMCGSIILCRGLERPIIGIHVAGISRGNVRGIAEMLVFESFSDIPKLNKDYESYIIPDLTDSEFSRIKISNSLYPLGCVDQSVSVHNMGVTSIVPSLIQGVFPVTTEPGPLSKIDKRLPVGSRPLEDGIAHMGKPPKDFDPDELRNASEDLLNVLKSVVIPMRESVGECDYQTVVCGIKGKNGYEPLEWSTSPGFPLRFMKDKPSQSGKKWLFNLEETEEGHKLLGFHKKLKDQIILERNMRMRNIKPFTVFIDCLKDHCLPVEKCSIPGKTRIFSISPVQFTIEFKKYYLDFMAGYQSARLNAEHGIGIDVNSLEWSDLVGKLLVKGKNLVCGDYKNYGPGLMLSAANEAMECIISWYEFHGDSKNTQMRRILKSEILHAYHLVENLIYSCPCGIPSGSPITTPLNSLVGSLYIRMAWKFTTNLSFKEMRELTYHCVYGDDVIIAVNDSIKEIFNTETISSFFQLYNIVFTDADKTGNIIKFRDILTASFLKCHFVPHPKRNGLWLAKLDQRSVEGCVNWVNKRNDPIKAIIDNCEQALELAHGHGQEYYNRFLDTLIKAMANNQLMFRHETWDDIDRRRYSPNVFYRAV